MKKKRTIAIENPKLRKIRDNFRDLWIKWSQDVRSNIRKSIHKINRNADGMPKALDEMTPKEQETFRKLRKKINEIRNVTRESICMCTLCGKGDRDMTFNPVDQEWYCTQCYEQNKEFFKDTDKADWYP
ncbi:MAG: hypothetical protein ACTSO4_17330 [Promethearchaeota archaeon]